MEDIKRLTSGLIGFPLVVMILLIGNKYIVDCLLAVVSLLAIDEYFKAVSKLLVMVKFSK